MSEADESVLARMRGDWNRRAEEDHKLHIAAGHAGSEEAFRASGEKDLDTTILDGVVLGGSAEALEIGCGVGRLLVPLARRVRVAHGVDISPVMIEKSKEYASGVPNVTTTLTDGAFTHLADSSLDFVFSFIVFQHIPDRAPIRRYVEEAARVLKPGGVFRFQVDGRWWWNHVDGGPDTYQGVKFSPEDVRALLAPTPFEIVDEWGAEGHYHWITARRRGEGAAVSLRPRGWDLSLLAAMLARTGSQRPEKDARKIRDGASLRPHLQRLVERLSGVDASAFVAEAYRALLGRAHDDAGRAFHVDILTRGFEDREALLDTIATSRGFLDIYRPHAPEVPWFVSFEILARLGDRPKRADFLELVSAVAARLAGRSSRDAIAVAFDSILGFEPDEAALRHHLPLYESEVGGPGLLVRELLSNRRDPEPPVAPGSLVRLLPGESAPGEAGRAAKVLREGANVDGPRFVRLAYRRLFGREVDTEGEAFYVAKLAGREMSRTAVLRELLWSEEGSARGRPSPFRRVVRWMRLSVSPSPR